MAKVDVLHSTSSSSLFFFPIFGLKLYRPCPKQWIPIKAMDPRYGLLGMDFGA